MMEPTIAARLDHAELGYPCPALWVMESEVLLSADELDEMGFRPMRDYEAGEALPQASGVAVDLRHDRRIALLSTTDPYPTLFQCQFADPHERRWADDGHAEGQVLLFIGPDRSVETTGIRHWLGDALVAVTPLAVFVFSWGVGTRARTEARADPEP